MDLLSLQVWVGSDTSRVRWQGGNWTGVWSVRERSGFEVATESPSVEKPSESLRTDDVSRGKSTERQDGPELKGMYEYARGK